MREGKNREMRNVLAHLGLEVNRLIRVSYGPFQLGELAEGGGGGAQPVAARSARRADCGCCRRGFSTADGEGRPSRRSVRTWRPTSHDRRDGPDRRSQGPPRAGRACRAHRWRRRQAARPEATQRLQGQAATRAAEGPRTLMRIVAGRLRGRTLAAPKSQAIRPTADRLRESLFNILTHSYGDPLRALACSTCLPAPARSARGAVARRSLRAVHR